MLYVYSGGTEQGYDAKAAEEAREGCDADLADRDGCFLYSSSKLMNGKQWKNEGAHVDT